MRDLTTTEWQSISAGFYRGAKPSENAIGLAILSSFVLGPGALAVMGIELCAGAALGAAAFKATATLMYGMGATGTIVYWMDKSSRS